MSSSTLRITVQGERFSPGLISEVPRGVFFWFLFLLRKKSLFFFPVKIYLVLVFFEQAGIQKERWEAESSHIH